MANAEGELLACQPYGGASTKIADYGLGQGPNVVIGLCEQFGLQRGTKVKNKKISAIFFHLHKLFNNINGS